MTRLGILGGTFDPPHKGHLALAIQALKQLRLERVIFIPAFIPPHKKDRSTSTGRHRLAMVRLLIKNRKDFHVSDIELRRRGVSYTIDTLKYFKRRFPHSELILIIGEDNLLQFHSWKSPKRILEICTLAVYRRREFHDQRKTIHPPYIKLKGQLLNVSSTIVRTRIHSGLSISTFVPPLIGNYIKQNVLYLGKSKEIKTKQPHENSSTH